VRPWRTAVASIALFAAVRPNAAGSMHRSTSRRYRLDGYDRDWHDAGHAPVRVLHGLAAWQVFVSRHRVEQRWRWNEKAATLGFSVLPAYYQI
jgi:hypothetical protein